MIINATPHKVCIYSPEQVFEDKSSSERKEIRSFILDGSHKNRDPIAIIPPSGKLLNANPQKVLSSYENDIPLFSLTLGEVEDPLEVFPEIKTLPDRAYIIVTPDYLSNYKAQFNSQNQRRIYHALLNYELVTVSDDVVYDDPENPRPIGCLGLVLGDL